MTTRARREEADARRAVAQAKMAEHELERLQGKYVEVAVVKDAYVREVTAAKTKLLGVPTRLKQRRPDVANDIIRLVDDLIREALSDIADGQGMPAVKGAASKSKSKPVGGGAPKAEMKEEGT